MGKSMCGARYCPGGKADFYFLHNALQLSAKQMAPEARGSALAVYAFCLFLGQPTGAAAGALLLDRYGLIPIIACSTLTLPIAAWWFARRLGAKKVSMNSEKQST